MAITLSQSIAVGFLVLLAFTQLLADRPGMLWVAVACYLLRQPLMNMAGPITSELAMSYVGERNRELVAALHATTWSGAWFVSAPLAWTILGIWLVVVLLYGLYRSLGKAEQDPIRKSGPLVED